VLVEALTGRRALDDRRPKDEANLIDWARPYLSERCVVSSPLYHCNTAPLCHCTTVPLCPCV